MSGGLGRRAGADRAVQRPRARAADQRAAGDRRGGPARQHRVHRLHRRLARHPMVLAGASPLGLRRKSQHTSFSLIVRFWSLWFVQFSLAYDLAGTSGSAVSVEN